MAFIAPSLLAADFARLGEALGIMKAAGATMVHVDVMDGHFTPDVSVGQPVIHSLRKATDLVLDVHLLIERPERYVKDFIDAGADRLAVHVEATHHLPRLLEFVRARQVKAGVALSPATPLAMVGEILEDIDFLLVLTAEPLLKNEDLFHAGLLPKVHQAARMRAERRLSFDLEVEGGVDFEHVEQLTRAGADILVAGSAIFQKDDPKARLAEMIALASTARNISRV